MHDYSYDLAALQGESEILFRFVFVADQATNEEGAVIDDLVIEGTLSNTDITFLDAILVSPNPSKDTFNLQWKSQGDVMNLSVFGVTGKKIINK